MSMSGYLDSREFDKFVEDASGNTAVRVLLAGSPTLVDLTLTGNFNRSVETGITAAGTIQGDAYALTKDSNWVSTVGAGSGVKLRSAVAGGSVLIVNESATTLKIYPFLGDDLGAGANTAIQLIAGGKIRFDAKDATTWKAG